MMEIPYKIWASFANDNLFYSDLIASLDALEAGQVTKRNISSWLRKKGCKIDWDDYSLVCDISPHEGVNIACPHCNGETTVYHFYFAALPCDFCDVVVNREDWIAPAKGD